MSPLKLCLLSSEIVPYAKTGGLADVAGALLHNLRAVGHDVRGFMPLYAAVKKKYPELAPVSAVQ
jgi:starch synthase